MYMYFNERVIITSPPQAYPATLTTYPTPAGGRMIIIFVQNDPQGSGNNYLDRIPDEF